MTVMCLSDLGQVITGNTPSKSIDDFYDSEDICFVKPSDFYSNSLSKIDKTENYLSEKARCVSRIVPKGSILVTCIGIIGKVAVLNGDAAFNQQINAIIPDKKKVLPMYLAYSLLSKQQELAWQANAAVVPIINKSQFSKLQLDIPDIDSQNKIISVLSKVDTLTTRFKKQLEDLDLLIKSRFIEMFGDPAINPYSYPVKSIADIADYWNGLTYKPDDVSVNGTIVLRSSNIQDGKLDFKDIVRVTCKIGEKKYVKINDILMCSRNGSAKLVGKVALIDSLIEPMCFGAFMMIIRSDYYPYLLTYFNTEAFRRQLSVGATTTINQITGNMLSQIKLPVPPVEQVKEYLSFMTQVDKSKLAVQQSLNELETLKKSLMQQYFG